MPIVVESDEITMGNDTDSRPSSVEPSSKAMRTGKQYKCPHCSYSADKKVSVYLFLNLTLNYYSMIVHNIQYNIVFNVPKNSYKLQVTIIITTMLQFNFFETAKCRHRSYTAFQRFISTKNVLQA